MRGLLCWLWKKGMGKNTALIISRTCVDEEAKVESLVVIFESRTSEEQLQWGRKFYNLR